MKILYISVHGVLEWSELKLLTSLGHECFSTGEFRIPVIEEGAEYLRKRPNITEMVRHENLEPFVKGFPDTNISQELIDWCDCIIVMHDPNVIVTNWDKFKASGKPVVWRSIGQSTIHVENMLRKMRYEGMKIVRMSQKEENIVGYMGSDALIRFGVNTEELQGWTGEIKRAMNVSQSLLGRRVACHYDQIMQTAEGFPFIVYGSGNNDLGSANGGEVPYELLKGALRDNRVFIYGGTFPSPYTLSIMDAMSTGIPCVCIGSKLAEAIQVDPQDNYHYYEMEDIIKDGENGFISNNINELRDDIARLMEDYDLAKRIGNEGRKTAIRLWDHGKIQMLWRDFINSL